MSDQSDPAALMAKLRLGVKASNASYADIGRSAGKSASWVGEVLRGGYPYRGANRLPKNIFDALVVHGLDVPESLLLFAVNTFATEPQKVYLRRLITQYGAKPDAWSDATGRTVASLTKWPDTIDKLTRDEASGYIDVLKEALAGASR